MIDYSKLGKQNKRKGYYGESSSAKFWQQKLGGMVKPTPRSGGIFGIEGDIRAKDNIIADNPFVIDCKYGDTALPKRIEQQMNKLKDDALGKDHWLELIKPRGEVYVVLPRNILAKLLVELQGWRQDNQSQ